jgi:adenylate cyclase class 2
MLDDIYEIEVKFYIEDLGQVEARLHALGAERVQARVHEYNLRFDTPAGELARQSTVLRLRQDATSRLTYKGANVVVEGVSRRKEIEFALDDFNAARALLDALGYRVSMVYEKYRAVYSLEAVLVTLDEMPFGNFVEIEGPDGRSIRKISAKLGLNWDTRIQDSYAALFRTACRTLGLETSSLTFETFAGLSITPAHLGVSPADGEA